MVVKLILINIYFLFFIFFCYFGATTSIIFACDYDERGGTPPNPNTLSRSRKDDWKPKYYNKLRKQSHQPRGQ